MPVGSVYSGKSTLHSGQSAADTDVAGAMEALGEEVDVSPVITTIGGYGGGKLSVFGPRGTCAFYPEFFDLQMYSHLSAVLQEVKLPEEDQLDNGARDEKEQLEPNSEAVGEGEAVQREDVQ